MASPPLLGYADDTSTWVRCGKDNVLIAVLNMERFLRRFSEDDDAWGTLPDGSLLELISAPERMGYQEPEFHAVWVSGDAVLGCFAETNWVVFPTWWRILRISFTKSTLRAEEPQLAMLNSWNDMRSRRLGGNPPKSCYCEPTTKMYRRGPTRAMRRRGPPAS